MAFSALELRRVANIFVVQDVMHLNSIIGLVLNCVFEAVDIRHQPLLIFLALQDISLTTYVSNDSRVLGIGRRTSRIKRFTFLS